MSMHPITTLELRCEQIPRTPLIELIERETGADLTREHRHYLEGQPVHCGNCLELYRHNGWETGRYEWTGDCADLPSLHLADGIVLLNGSQLLRWPER